MKIVVTIILFAFNNNLLIAQLNYEWSFNPKTDYPIPGNVEGRGIKADSSGNTYIVGTFSGTADFDPGPGIVNLTSIGPGDVFIAKYDPSGKIIFAKSFGGNGYDAAGNPFNQSCITFDADHNFFISGSFTDTADFDPGLGISNLISLNPNNIFIAKYDSSGNFIFAIGLVGGDFAIASDKLGNVFVTGTIFGTADFDPSPGLANLTSQGGSDLFLAKYDPLGNFIFAKNIGSGIDDAHSYAIAIDSTGNAIVTGKFYGLSTDFDPGPGLSLLTAYNFARSEIFLAKYDINGNYIFAKSIGTPAAEDEGRAITTDQLDNIYLTGSFTDTVDFDPGPGIANLISFGTIGYPDIFISKYDASGNYAYAKNIGNPSGTLPAWSMAIAVDLTGSCYITGFFTGTTDFDPGPGIANLIANGFQDIFLAKLDPQGNYGFAMGMGGNSNFYNDVGMALTTDRNGNVIVTGIFKETADFDPGPGTANLTAGNGYINAYIGKYSSSGNYIWANALGGYSNIAYSDEGRDVTADKYGNIYITGSYSGRTDFDPSIDTAFLTPLGKKDIFIAKYDTSGKFLFAKGLGSPFDDVSNSICIDESENINISGYFNGSADFDPGVSTATLTSFGSKDIFFAKYDTAGNYIFAKNIGSIYDDIGNSITSDSSGNVFIIGYFSDTADFDPGAGTADLISLGQNDIFFAKYDAAGNYRYAHRLGSLWYDEGSDIDCDKLGNVSITGIFAGTADFDPSAGSSVLTSGAGDDVFLAKYDSIGDYVYAKCLSGSNGLNIASSIKIDSLGNAYISGEFHKTVDFDPGTGVLNLTASGYKDIFLAKYDVLGNYLFANKIGGPSIDGGKAISIDNSGDVYLTGYFSGTADFDPTNGIENLTSTGNAKNIFMAKYDYLGNLKFAEQIGNYYDGICNSVSLDVLGNVYSTGYFSDILDFDPNSGTANLKSSNSNDIFIAKYKEGCSTHFITVSASTLYANIAGASYQWIDCNKGDSIIAGELNQSFTATTSGSYAAIITTNGCTDTTACITVNLVGNNEISFDSQIAIYPNPSHGEFTIHSMKFTSYNFLMYNIYGALVYQKTVDGNQATINIQAPAGIYFYKLCHQASEGINTNGRISAGKIIIQ